MPAGSVNKPIITMFLFVHDDDTRKINQSKKNQHSIYISMKYIYIFENESRAMNSNE